MAEDKPKLDLRGIDPRKEFFLATFGSYNDGSLEEMSSDYTVCDSLEKAVEYLLDELDDCLLDGYVFHCIPVRYVGRGPLRVRPLAEAPIKQRKANRTRRGADAAKEG